MKKGISLIVLVITIIVMIILAASVVISMSNTSIIDKAGHAVDLSDESQVQDLAAMTWADYYLNEKRGEELEEAVTTKLAEQGVKDTEYKIEVTDTGITVSKLVSFTIEGTKYQAVKGMNWKEWTESEYNTAGYFVNVQLLCIVSADIQRVLTEDNQLVRGGTLILEGQVYTHYKQ